MKQNSKTTDAPAITRALGNQDGEEEQQIQFDQDTSAEIHALFKENSKDATVNNDEEYEDAEEYKHSHP